MKKTIILTMALMFQTAGVLFADDPVVGSGKKVKADYTLFVGNEQIETSIGKEPLEYIAGDETIIPGLENQMTGMHVGEEKVIVVDAKDAYGELDAKAVKEFPKASLPKEAEPKVGMVLQATAPDGEQFPAVVKEINGDKVMLDFNHPLAGKQLKFNVKVLGVENAPVKEPKAAVKDIASIPAVESKVEVPVVNAAK